MRGVGCQPHFAIVVDAADPQIVTFAALDEATGEMLGFGAGGADEALTLDDMMPFPVRRDGQRAEDRLGKSSASALLRLVRRFPVQPFTLRALRDEIMKSRNNAAARRLLVASCGAAFLISCGAAAAAAPTGTHLAAAASRDITIDGKAVYPESVTAAADGTVFVGSLGGTIYRAAPASRVAEPWVHRSERNGLLSIFGVLADDRSESLWVCTSPAAIPGGIAPGTAAVVRFDLRTGTLLGRYPLPAPHAICDDIARAGDGTAYVADIGSGEILTLAPGSQALQIFAAAPELVGVDGIAFAADGTLYVDNVRRNELLRVERRADGRFQGLTALRSSQPIRGPDGLRPVAGNRFVLAEGRSGRIDEVTLHGDEAQIRVLQSGLDSPSGVAYARGAVYAVEGKIEYLFDPKLRARGPGRFVVRVIAAAR